MKKFIAILLCMLFVLGQTACNKPSTNGADADDVIIEFAIANLGYGKDWLESANQRFMYSVEDKEYPNGKKGVYCKYVFGTPEQATSISTSGTHVYYSSGRGTDLANTGNLLCIDEIVKEKYDNGKSIEDKMYEDYKEFSLGNDGKYYTIPTFESYCGLSYDKDLFNRNGYYFANNDAEDYTPRKSELINYTYNLVDVNIEGWENNKSCGPNGEYGDYDDGLPSSLYELIALWEFMSKDGVQPVQLAGEYPNIANFFLDGLMASLMGESRAEATQTFNGTMEVVTGFGASLSQRQNIINGVDYLDKPTTKTVQISEETGFYTTMAVERYYALAALEIIEKENFWAQGSDTITESLSHLDAQKMFIDSGYTNIKGQAKEVGMIMEGSYWYNESTIRGNFRNFYSLNKDCKERGVAWMPLPVNIANSVTGEDRTETFNGITESVKGERATLVQAHQSCLYFNKNIEKDQAVYEAVKDWIKFMHTDEELSNITADSGFKRALIYEVDDKDKENWSGFYADLFEYAKDAYVLRPVGGNKTYNANASSLYVKGEHSGFWNCHRTSFMFCLGKSEHNAQVAFENKMLTAQQWKNSYYQGSNKEAVDYIDNIVYNKPEWNQW